MIAVAARSPAAMEDSLEVMVSLQIDLGQSPPTRRNSSAYRCVFVDIANRNVKLIGKLTQSLARHFHENIIGQQCF